MGGRQEDYLKLFCGITKPNNEAFCEQELSSQGLQVETGKGLGARPPKLLLGQCSVQEGQDLLPPYSKQHSSAAPAALHTEKATSLFCLPSCRLLQWRNTMYLYFSNFLDAWIPSQLTVSLAV